MAAPGVIAAVLAGGRGERLGGGKPSLDLGGRPLVCHALGAAADAELDAVVVAKRDTRLPRLEVPVLREPDDPRHPLCGVVEAVGFAADHGYAAVLVLACDMPFITGPLLAWMARLDGAAIGRVDGAIQPLPARVPVEGLSSLRRALADRRSLRSAFEELAPRLLEDDLARFGDARRIWFRVNEPSDLRAARGRLCPAG